MKKIIHKLFVEPLGDYIAEKVISYWRTHGMSDMAWSVFSWLGLDEIEKAIEEQKKKDKNKSINSYSSLAEVYNKRLKNMTRERLQKALDKLTELEL